MNPAIESGNAVGRHANCMDCTKALIRTLGGNPTSALLRTDITVSSREVGTKRIHLTSSADEVINALLDAGEGALSEVSVPSSKYAFGTHSIGAVNYEGTVSFIDGQNARIVNPTEVIDFRISSTRMARSAGSSALMRGLKMVPVVGTCVGLACAVGEARAGNWGRAGAECVGAFCDVVDYGILAYDIATYESQGPPGIIQSNAPDALAVAP